MKSSDLLRSQRGYAIIEVVFLVSVIAILSTIIVPKIDTAYQNVYADYAIKNVYSGIRLSQAANRTAIFNADNIMNIKRVSYSFYISSSYDRTRYMIANGDGNILYNYYLPPNFSFENRFRFIVSGGGIVHDLINGNNTSGHLILQRNSKNCNPFIIYDSVGRIRIARNN